MFIVKIFRYNNNMTFSELLRKYRIKHRLKKKEVAKLLNWTPMYYSRFENGQLLPTKGNIDKFKNILSISDQDIIKFIK
jgi:transcriptional regulator with XRE-family HTH domain